LLVRLVAAINRFVAFNQVGLRRLAGVQRLRALCLVSVRTTTASSATPSTAAAAARLAIGAKTAFIALTVRIRRAAPDEGCRLLFVVAFVIERCDGAAVEHGADRGGGEGKGVVARIIATRTLFVARFAARFIGAWTFAADGLGTILTRAGTASAAAGPT